MKRLAFLLVIALSLTVVPLAAQPPGQPAQQPGTVPPGAQPPGAMPPGAMPPGAVQPGGPAGETPVPTVGGWPDWVERWLFNPSERTQRGVRAAERGNSEGARRALETAARLDQENPAAQYNAGTGRLNADIGDPTPYLQAAAMEPNLAPNANYNLGNLHFKDQNYEQAIESYKNALRAAPDMADAKHNLELALRRLEEQQQQQQQDQQQQNEDQEDQEEQQDQEQQEQEQDQQDQQEQDQQDQQEQDQQQQDQQEQDQQQQDQQQQQQQESPLPQFEDLPDMTAEEAAQILEAIENMERERRRKEAKEAAKKNARGKKDW